MSLRFRIGPFTFGKSGTRLSLWSGGTGFSTPIFNNKASSYGKVRFGIFSYFFNGKAKSLRNRNAESNYQNGLKGNHSQAYEPWSKEADEELMALFRQGKTVNELSAIFGRTRGAIRSRIDKLMLQ